MAILTYLESTDDNSLSQFGFSTETGTGGGTYQFNDVTDLGDLQASVTDILGFTNTTRGSNQKLNRVLPCTHPAFRYMYASQILGMVGIGSKKAVRVPAEVSPITGTPQAITSTFNLYNKYQIQAKFSTKPYTLLDNKQINIKTSMYEIPPATLGGAAPSPVSISYATEWMRYTDYTLKPQNNVIQGSVGAFSFKDLPSKPIYTSPPFMNMPDQILSFTWYQVPYRFVTSANSYITNPKWLNRINQHDWYNWKKGSLLYLGYDPGKTYTQPSDETISQTDLNGDTWDSYAKLTDITFTFLYTARSPGTTPTPPAYGNWLAAGHNLQPVLSSRTFEYATMTNTGSDALKANQQYWAPTYESFPLELLFSDPDCPGAYAIT